VAPGSPRRDRITVVRDFVIGDLDPSPNNGKAQLYVEHAEPGRIDRSSVSFLSRPGMQVRVLLELVEHRLQERPPRNPGSIRPLAELVFLQRGQPQGMMPSRIVGDYGLLKQLAKKRKRVE
jgi:hypothetical protein